MPEPFDAGALALLTEVDPRDSGLVGDGGPDRTTALERHPAPSDEPAAAPVTEPMRTTTAPAAATTTAVAAVEPRPGPGRAPTRATHHEPVC